MTTTRTGSDGYDDAVGRARPARGERAALIRYLEPDEPVRLRQPVAEVGEADGRVLLAGGAVVLVTDRKLVAARTTGGFRPQWEVFTLPYGHLEPGVAARDSEVCVPTSGRRSYRIILGDNRSADTLARDLATSLHSYRRDRMGLDDA